jgi:hypothetical protein
MVKRELYLCIRFSNDFIEKFGEKGLQDVKKGFDKQVPEIAKKIKTADKKVKVWTKLI